MDGPEAIRHNPRKKREARETIATREYKKGKYGNIFPTSKAERHPRKNRINPETRRWRKFRIARI
jgi:hypothetical protein